MAAKPKQQKEPVAAEAQAAPSQRLRPSSFIDKVMLDHIPKEER
jgi:hypothetical protein